MKTEKESVVKKDDMEMNESLNESLEDYMDKRLEAALKWHSKGASCSDKVQTVLPYPEGNFWEWVEKKYKEEKDNK